MQSKYFIIAGTNKAATTSLFEYLGAHPAVCPSFIKQTFFFLDKDWQQQLNLKSLYDYEKGFEQFNLFFRDCGAKQIKLEASPEYLYAPGTPQRLAVFASQEDVKIIFILRNPVKRFVSLFYFGKQLGLLQKEYGFHQFLQDSMQHKNFSNTSLMAYETGFYSKYLQRYFQLFNKENMFVYFSEDLEKDTKVFMKKASVDADIDAAFYNDFNFETHNKTIAVKNARLGRMYYAAREFMIEHGYKSKAGYAIGNFLKKTITPLYRKINMEELQKETIAQEDLALLTEAYKNEKQNLEQLLQVKVPW